MTYDFTVEYEGKEYPCRLKLLGKEFIGKR